jgi:hypothetical protein
MSRKKAMKANKELKDKEAIYDNDTSLRGKLGVLPQQSWTRVSPAELPTTSSF